MRESWIRKLKNELKQDKVFLDTANATVKLALVLNCPVTPFSLTKKDTKDWNQENSNLLLVQQKDIS